MGNLVLKTFRNNSLKKMDNFGLISRAYQLLNIMIVQTLVPTYCFLSSLFKCTKIQVIINSLQNFYILRLVNVYLKQGFKITIIYSVI